MGDIRSEDIESIVRAEDNRSHFRVVFNGELVVLVGEGRIFVFNRSSRKAFEIQPDFEVGITVNVI